MVEQEVPREREETGTRSRFSFRPRRGLRRFWPIAAVAVAAAAGIYLLLAMRSGPETEEESAAVVTVRVAKVEKGSIAAQVTVLGTLFPRHEATVSAKISGQIKRMDLLRNKAFKEGEVIAVFDSRDLQAQRAEAAAALQEALASERSVTSGNIPQTAAQDEKAIRDATANLNNALATLERRRTLYAQGGISKKDLEASELAVATAENELKLAERTAKLHATTMSPNERALAASRVAQARDRLASLDTRLSYATIRAPFSGVVSEQFQFQGEFVAEGAKLFTIGDTSEVIVKAPVGDTVAAQLKVGDPVVVYPQELTGEQLDSTISLISRSEDPQSRSVEIWIPLKNPDGRLRADSAAKVVLSTRSASDVIVIPASAVTLDATNADRGVVMVVDADSVAHETGVTVGIRTVDKMEITSGLSGGETIVVEGNYALPDGTRVKVADAEQGSGQGGGGEKEKAGDDR